MENHAIFATYLTEDLSDPLLKTRLDLCRRFGRLGMYVFKIGSPYKYTNCSLKEDHIQRLESGRVLNNNEFVTPRYRVSGKYIVDILEFMTKVLVFPLNAMYNVLADDWDTVSYNATVVSAGSVILEIFFGAIPTTPMDISEERHTPAPRRSVPVYVSDTRICIPTLRLRNCPLSARN